MSHPDEVRPDAESAEQNDERWSEAMAHSGDGDGLTSDAAEPAPTDADLVDRIGQHIGQLEQELAEARAERDQFRDLALRARADLDNYQKRASRDRETDRKFAAQPLVTDLLGAIDNLDRALAAADAGGVEGLLEGVRMVRKNVSDILARYNIHAIVPLGEPFNPDVHEAIMQQPSAEHPPGTVLIVYRTGYVMHERVIRPAQVVVSAETPPEASAPDSATADPEG